jgi:peptidoglycan/xylan/chitin deacetylase (PgdA/CDA1 family)
MMNKWKFFLKYTVSAVYGSTYNKFFPPSGVRILTYHSIGDKIPEDYLGYFNISPELFKKHMEYISENCHLISLAEMNHKSDGVAVTFDDGYANNLTVVAPILERLNIPFTVFATVDYIQNNNDLYLSTTELKELSALNCASVGSHCVTHSRLTQCDDQQLENELTYSKSFLEDLTGKNINSVAYPYGDTDQRVVKAAIKAGYSQGASVRFGINENDHNPLLLSRTDIWAHDDLKIFREKIEGYWDWMRWLN